MFEAIAVIAVVAVGGYLLYTKVIRPRWINNPAGRPRPRSDSNFGQNGS